MMNFIRWIAGAFEDAGQKLSRKAIILYWAMGLLTYLVIKSAQGAQINMEVYFGLVGLIGMGLGMVATELIHLRKGNHKPPPGP